MFLLATTKAIGIYVSLLLALPFVVVPEQFNVYHFIFLCLSVGLHGAARRPAISERSPENRRAKASPQQYVRHKDVYVYVSICMHTEIVCYLG